MGETIRYLQPCPSRHHRQVASAGLVLHYSAQHAPPFASHPRSQQCSKRRKGFVEVAARFWLDSSVLDVSILCQPIFDVIDVSLDAINVGFDSVDV